jgi:RNA polymerase sigma factor (sigma-70 family)
MEKDILYLLEVDKVIREAIENIARRYARDFGIDYDDLYQEGWIAYLKSLPYIKHVILNRIKWETIRHIRGDYTETISLHDIDVEGNNHSCGQMIKLDFIGLPERYKKIMELYFIDGYTQREIADKFNISQNRIKEIIQNSIKKLKK